MNSGILRAVRAIGRIFALVIWLSATARALPDEKLWHVLIEPKFMRPEISFPIPGAERTVFVPGWLENGELHYFSKTDFDALKLDWPAFRAKASANATDKKVKAEFTRTSKK